MQRYACWWGGRRLSYLILSLNPSPLLRNSCSSSAMCEWWANTSKSKRSQLLLNMYNYIMMAIHIDNRWHAVRKTGLENYLCFWTTLMMFHYIYSFVIFSSTAIKESTSSDNLTPKKWVEAISLLLGFLLSEVVFFYRSAVNLVCCCNHSILKSVGITQQKDPTEQSGQPNLQLPTDAVLPLLQQIRKKRVRRTDVKNGPIVMSLPLAERGPGKLEVWSVTGMLCMVWSRVLFCEIIGQAS